MITLRGNTIIRLYLTKFMGQGDLVAGICAPLHHTYTKTQTSAHRKHCAAITQLSATGMWGYNWGYYENKAAVMWNTYMQNAVEMPTFLTFCPSLKP